jgi:enoyl-CoA hydratase/carnithine racemase
VTEPLVVCERMDAVGVARLNRPDARNALSPELMEELAETVARWDSDPEVRCVVIAGKQAVLAGEETTLAAGLDQERRLYELAMATEDRVEGMTAFLEHRRPEFRGR